MDAFSLGGAWSKGFRFVADDLKGHAIILVVIGVLAPLALQLAVAGAGRPPDALGSPAGGARAAMDGAATAIGYWLYLGSYFASLRFGLGRGVGLKGALLYGLASGLAVMIGAIVLLALVAAPASQTVPAAVVPAVLLLLIAIAALLFPALAAMTAVALALAMGLAMLIGTITGDLGLAATLVGGSGAVAVLLIALSGLLLWLAARLSCTAALVAERRSLNVFAAMAESWRLTWEQEWAILRYLALAGLAMAVVAGAAAVAVGAAMAAAGQSGSIDETDWGGQLLALVLGTPFAFAAVIVPAGIYRELAGPPAPVEVFA